MSQDQQFDKHGALLPCPCCGGKALFGSVIEPDDKDFGARFVYCSACHLTSALVWPLKDDVTRELVERWNRRSVQSSARQTDEADYLRWWHEQEKQGVEWAVSDRAFNAPARAAWAAWQAALSAIGAREAAALQTIADIKWDVQNCDWHCTRCGVDQEMRQTDIAFTIREFEQTHGPLPRAYSKPISAAPKLTGFEHDLKCWPDYFEDVQAGRKTFELRKDDRTYAVGDVLLLREWSPDNGKYTGRSCRRVVTHLIRRSRVFGLLDEGACLMSIREYVSKP